MQFKVENKHNRWYIDAWTEQKTSKRKTRDIKKEHVSCRFKNIVNEFVSPIKVIP